MQPAATVDGQPVSISSKKDAGPSGQFLLKVYGPDGELEGRIEVVVLAKRAKRHFFTDGRVETISCPAGPARVFVVPTGRDLGIGYVDLDITADKLTESTITLTKAQSATVLLHDEQNRPLSSAAVSVEISLPAPNDGSSMDWYCPLIGDEYWDYLGKKGSDGEWLPCCSFMPTEVTLQLQTDDQGLVRIPYLLASATEVRVIPKDSPSSQHVVATGRVTEITIPSH